MLKRNADATAGPRTLDELITRLARHPLVDGLMLLGTTGTDALTPTSDYDLLLVFGELPAPLRMINTWVDGRLTEIASTTAQAIERIVASDEPWGDGSEEAVLLTWLREGRIAFDRDGRLAASRERARSAPPPSLADDRQIHEAWRKIGYNVAQVRRYLEAGESVARTIVDMRLLYSMAEVNLHYFTVRRIPWRGEKPAVHYWTQHDPEYLDNLHRYFEERDLRRRVALYEKLAALALAPVGPLWGRDDTMVSIGAGYGAGRSLPRDAEDGQQALALWERLLAPRGQRHDART
jgi:hypothetical protein